MWQESKHPRDELGRFTDKEKVGNLLGVNLGTHVNTKKTGMTYYDNFLNPTDAEYMRKNKNLKGDIQMMSPKEYYQMVADKIFTNTSVKNLLEQRRIDQDSSHLADVLKRGESLDMPMINLANKGQEGLHRMMVLGDMYGWDEKQPVLVVDWDDIEKEKQYHIRIMDNHLDHVRDEYADKDDFLRDLNKHIWGNTEVIPQKDGYILKDKIAEKNINIHILLKILMKKILMRI